MCGMRISAKAVDNKHIGTDEQFDHLPGYFTEIRSIADRLAITVEPICCRLRRSMRHLATCHGKASTHAQGSEVIQRNARGATELAGADIAETLARAATSLFSSIAGDRSAASVSQRTQVVDPVAMVGMIVGPEHGIEATDPVRQQLAATVGRGIDQNSAALIVFQDYRHARAAIPGFIRVALTPIGPGFASKTRNAS